jgi:putative membrane protein
MKIKTLALVFAFAIPAVASADKQATPDTSTQSDKPTGKSTTDKSKTDKSTTDKTAAKLGDAEMKIVERIHHMNMMDIDLGKLAEKSGTPAVKRFGETIVRDQQAADKELTSFAKKRGVAKIPAHVPETEADKADMKAQTDTMASIKKLKAAEFDRQYLQMMVDNRDKELARNEIAVAAVSDPDLKSMLENRRTTLQRHVDAARELQKGNAQASSQPAPKK